MNSTSADTNGLSTANNQTMGGNGTTTLDATVPLLSAHIAAKRLIVAFVSWVIYEMVITHERGVTLFWKQPLGKSKILFLLASQNRYSSVFTIGVMAAARLVANPPVTVCRASPWLTPTGNTILFSIINYSLILRVSALWSHRPVVVWISKLLFALHFLFQTIVLSYFNAT
ncbi:hypothetical protein CPB86DRAFT_826880, partial [Serendipita vermifera]